MSSNHYDVAVIGSGAGGATLARELRRRGANVVVIERGKQHEKFGSFRHSLAFFDANRVTKVPRKSKEGVILWRTIMAGGSSVVSCGNATRCLETELADLGVHLAESIAEAETDLNVAPISETLVSEGSEAIMAAAQKLDYEMEPMPKFIDPALCNACGQCVFGCPNHAKWTALDYLAEATAGGAEILYNTTVQRVLQDLGSARGIHAIGLHGDVDVMADVVVVAAGGLGTPPILQQSGIPDAGKGLFTDLLVNTYGVTEDLSLVREPSMALVNHQFHDSKGFILSPYANHSRMVRSMEFGPRAFSYPSKGILGMMTKTADDAVGTVFPDGSVSKPVTEDDWARLREGSAISREILIQAGADPSSIIVSVPQGAHPGGTAAIGRVVDENLETEIKNLFVCDASVLPKAPGMPPILTIVALAKRLAKHLTSS